MYHELKIWPQYFTDVQRDRKRAELRKDDRGYEAGDVLKLREYDPVSREYTGRHLTAVITHVLRIRDLDTPMKNVLGINPCLAQLNELSILSIQVMPS